MGFRKVCKTLDMKDSAGGFTIVELMVTVVVASVLFATAIPSFVSLIRNNRLAAQANDFTASLMFARTEAVKRGVNVVMCRTAKADPGATGLPCDSSELSNSALRWNDGWVVFVDANNNGVNDTGELILQLRGPLQGGTYLVGNNNVSARVSFRPQGVVGAGGIGGFTLVDERAKLGNPDAKKMEGTRLICIGMTGRSRIAKLPTDVATDTPISGLDYSSLQALNCK